MSMIEVSEVERRIADRVDPTIAGALSVSRHAGGLSFTNAGEAMEFAKMMAVSQIGVRKHLRGNVGACLAITVQSIERIIDNANAHRRARQLLRTKVIWSMTRSPMNRSSCRLSS